MSFSVSTAASQMLVDRLDNSVPFSTVGRGSLWASAYQEANQSAMMKAAALVVISLGTLGTSSEVFAVPCSSYYISEITLVSPGDTAAGRVHTFVGFGASKEEAQKNALGSCSHIQLDLETCLASDRVLDRNAPPMRLRPRSI